MFPRSSTRVPVAALAFALALALLGLVAPRIAHASDASKVTLYTIGPGSILFARHGHSVLCVDDACFDYGLPVRDDALELFWHGMRGIPDFAPIRVERARVLSAFGGEERSIEAQDIPLDDGARARLLSRLEREVSAKRAYAYNPWFDNCTTHLRDALDEVAAGKLRGVTELGNARTFRELSEAGFSGQPLPLLAMALALGQGERVGSPFERMFLPAGLRDGVTRAFGVVPERVHEYRGSVLATSVHAGRVSLVVIGALLALALVLSRKRPAIAGVVRAAVVLVLSLLGAIVWGVALLTHYPEVAHNWNVLVFVPFDAVLLAISAERARVYVRARMAIVVLLSLAATAGLLTQPLGVPALAALLPLLAWSMGHASAASRLKSPA